MKEKHKNRESELTEFQRYAEGKMTSKEKNAFERNLMKDPFAAEASEGLDLITPEETGEDLNELNHRLTARTSRRNRVMYYRIAASVAAFMILSSVYLILRQTRPSQQINEVAVSPQVNEIIQHEVIPQQRAAEKEEKPVMIEKKKVEADNTGYDAGQPETKGVQATATEEGKSTQRAEQIATKDLIIIPTDKKMAAPASAMAAVRPQQYVVSGKIISSEDNLPLTGASIVVKGSEKGVLTDTGGNFKLALTDPDYRTLVASYIGMEQKEFQADNKEDMKISLNPAQMALDEVVVVGYGSRKNAGNTGAVYEAKNDQSGYAPPQPVNGQKEFDKYIEENIRKPESQEPGKRAVVVLNFIVRATGSLDSINVVRSPGDEYSGEAKRLLKEGPQWKPASDNGRDVDDVVRLRIVFK